MPPGLRTAPIVAPLLLTITPNHAEEGGDDVFSHSPTVYWSEVSAELVPMNGLCVYVYVFASNR